MAAQILETAHRLASGLLKKLQPWDGGLPRLLLTKAHQTTEGLERGRELGGVAVLRVATSALVGAVQDHHIGVKRRWHLDWHVTVWVGSRVLFGVLLLHEVRRRGELNNVLQRLPIANKFFSSAFR